MQPAELTIATAALEEAIRLAGGVTALANSIGVRQNFVSTWRGRGFAPTERAAVIEREIGVPAKRLRPDAPWRHIKDRAWPGGWRPVLDYARA